MQNTTIQGFRLSPQQERVWFLQKANLGQNYYAVCSVLCEGNLNINILEKTLKNIVNQHEILRTNFLYLPNMNAPVQVIDDECIFSVQNYNLESWKAFEQEARFNVLFQETKQQLFNLEHGSSLRASLVTLSSHRHILLLSLPALCADTSTLENLINKISYTYAIYLQGQEVSDDPMQYADISEWQNELLESEDTVTGREYWQKQDFSHFSFLTLPFEKQLLLEGGFEPQVLTSIVPTDILEKLEKAIQTNNTSITTFLLTCWQILLWRIINQPEIIVGVAFSGRKYEELQEALGLLGKYLPIGYHMVGSLQFHQVLDQINESMQEAYNYQDYLDWREVIKQYDESLSFLPFSFEFHNHSKSYSHIRDTLFSIEQFYVCYERFKIKLACIQTTASLKLEFYYDSCLFDTEDIQRLQLQFHALLNSILNNSEIAIEKIKILSIEEQQLLANFNNTKVDYPKGKCIHHLFEEQVKRVPNNIALVVGEQKITYAELNVRANQLAHYLQKLGIQPESLVGICTERSLETIIGILGIIKAGGAYVPLDPSYPQEHLNFILEDTQASVLLTQKRLLRELPNHQTQVIYLDAEWEKVSYESQENCISGVTQDNLIYVIYTSGSTGKPKGVLVTHQNLVCSTNSRMTYYHEPVNSFLLLSSFAFDSSVAGIFWTLCQGGILFLPQQEIQYDLPQLTKLIAKNRISHLLTLPSLYALFLEQDEPQELMTLNTVIVAGESCSRELLERHHQLLPQTSIYNEYGPTEATVWCSVFKSQSLAERKQVPIGKPIDNTQIYLLDKQLNIVPIYTPGELYIGGVGLTRGYFNRPELNADRFIPNFFSNELGARLYKTGDLARYLPNGDIEFLGRIDQQVKIRGFRIELGEIEAVLRERSEVQEAVVIDREDIPGQKCLVAYIVPKQEQKPHNSELRSFIKAKLPEYMMPVAFIWLPVLPLTPNGKVNRRALPAPEDVRSELQVAYVAPQTEIESVIAEIWRDLLHVEKVGINDNFFDIGGHSLLMIQVQSKLQTLLKRDLSIVEMFKYPTVKYLANYLTQAEDKSSSQESCDRANTRKRLAKKQSQRKNKL